MASRHRDEDLSRNLSHLTAGDTAAATKSASGNDVRGYPSFFGCV
jgi:hypothetical protein